MMIISSNPQMVLNIKKGDYVWVEVSTVIWLIDDETELLTSKKGLASGIRFLDRILNIKVF